MRILFRASEPVTVLFFYSLVFLLCLHIHKSIGIEEKKTALFLLFVPISIVLSLDDILTKDVANNPLFQWILFSNYLIRDICWCICTQLSFYVYTYVRWVVQKPLIRENVLEDSANLFYRIICATMHSC
jgi:hypothetical protein